MGQIITTGASTLIGDVSVAVSKKTLIPITATGTVPEGKKWSVVYAWIGLLTISSGGAGTTAVITGSTFGQIMMISGCQDSADDHGVTNLSVNFDYSQAPVLVAGETVTLPYDVTYIHSMLHVIEEDA